MSATSEFIPPPPPRVSIVPKGSRGQVDPPLEFEPVTEDLIFAGPGESVAQPTAHPTQKVWSFLTSTGFLTALFAALQDYGVSVPPNTQALVTILLGGLAAYLTPSKAGE